MIGTIQKYINQFIAIDNTSPIISEKETEQPMANFIMGMTNHNNNYNSVSKR